MVPVQLPFYLQALTNAALSERASDRPIHLVCVSSISYQRIKARLSFMSIYRLAFLSMRSRIWTHQHGGSCRIVLLGSETGLGLLLPNMNLY